MPASREYRSYGFTNESSDEYRGPRSSIHPHNRLDELVRLSRQVTDRDQEIKYCHGIINRIRAEAERLAESKRNIEGDLIFEQHAFSKVKADLRAGIEMLERETNDLQGEITALNEQIDEQNVAVELGKSLFVQNNDKIKQLEKQNRLLRDIVRAKSERVNILDGQVKQAINASVDEITSLALELQAESALNMIEGLKADIAERDTIIERLRITTAEHERVNEFDHAPRSTPARSVHAGRAHSSTGCGDC